MPQRSPCSSTLQIPSKCSASDSGPPTRSNNEAAGATSWQGLGSTSLSKYSPNNNNLSCPMPRRKHKMHCDGQGTHVVYGPQMSPRPCQLVTSRNNTTTSVPFRTRLVRVNFTRFASLSPVISIPCDTLLRYQGLLPTWLHHMPGPIASQLVPCQSAIVTIDVIASLSIRSPFSNPHFPVCPRAFAPTFCLQGQSLGSIEKTLMLFLARVEGGMSVYHWSDTLDRIHPAFSSA
jgi:hypothetical protein